MHKIQTMGVADLENNSQNPGDELRDQAANLLSVKYGVPIVEKRIGGKKVDVCFRYRDLGRERSLFLECKDYAQPLNRSQVANIWSDYSGIIRQSEPAQLLVVTRNGLTTDATEFLNEEQVLTSHQTIWQLESDILGLTEYTRSLTKIFNINGLDQYYINPTSNLQIYDSSRPDGEPISSENVDLINFATAWIDGTDCKPLAILGGYGAGKTSFARRLISELATKALEDSTQRIPIYIKLGMFTRYASIESILAGMFGVEFPVAGFSVPTFLDCNSRGRFVIICDGFDEMKHAMTWADFRATISEINKLNEGSAKVILLGRPNAFLSTDEHIQILRGQKKFGVHYRKLPDWPEFTELKLNDFDPTQRADFIQKYLPYVLRNKHESKITALEVSSRVLKVNSLADSEPDIFSKPVHAQILTELGSEPSFDLNSFQNGVSRWHLYESFFVFLTEREVEKDARRQIGEKGRIGFLREIAYWLWSKKDGLTAFSVHEIPSILLGKLDDGHTTDYDSKLREYLTGAFLEKKSGEIYYFGHRSFAEFLVSHRLLGVLPEGKDHHFYAQILDGSVLDFFLEGIGNSSLLKWANTIDDYEGVYNVAYFRLIISKSPSFRTVRKEIRESSLIRSILNCFDDNIVYNQVFERRLIKMMRKSNSTEIFIILQFLNLSFSSREIDPIGRDFSVLNEFIDALWQRSSLIQGEQRATQEDLKNKSIIFHDTVAHKYLFNGNLLRKVLVQKQEATGVTVVDTGLAQKSAGWPDKFERKLSPESSRFITRIANNFKK